MIHIGNGDRREVQRSWRNGRDEYTDTVNEKTISVSIALSPADCATL